MVQYRIDVIIDPSGARAGRAGVERELNQLASSAERVRSTIGNAFKIIGAAKAIQEIVGLVDAYTRLQNRLRVVVEGDAALELATKRLLAIADRSRSSFESTAELYSRVALATRGLGKSQDDLLGITESVNKAIILSGASAKEANNGLIQLSQGIAANRLGGDELRSVLEQLPVVADVISKHLGITRGQLKALAATGAITGRAVIEAFEGARDEIEGKFAKTIPTIGQGLQVLRNNLVDTFGEFDKATGTSRTLSEALLFVAHNLETLVRLLATTGALTAAIKFAPLIGQAVASAKAFLEMRSAVAANRLVILGSAEAARQQAVFEQSRAAAVVESTAATLANTKAGADNALVVGGGNAALVEEAAARTRAAAATLAQSQTQVRAASAAAASLGQTTAASVAEAEARVVATRAALAQFEAQAATTLVVGRGTTATVAAAEAEVVRAQATLRGLGIQTKAALAETARIAELQSAVEVLSLAAAAENTLVATHEELVVAGQAFATTEAELAAAVTVSNAAIAEQIAFEQQLAGLQVKLAGEQAALAAATANKSAADAATVFAATEVELAASVTAANTALAARVAVDQQLIGLEAKLAEEQVILAAANTKTAVTSAAAATEASLLGRSFNGIKVAISGIGAAILANPIGAALIALTAIIAPLIIFKDEIQISSNKLATLGDVFAATFDRFKPMLSSIGDFFVSVFDKIEAVIKRVFGVGIQINLENFIRLTAFYTDRAFGLWVGLALAIVAVFTGLPRALADLAIQGTNAFIGVFETTADVITAILVTILGQVESVVSSMVKAFGAAGTAISEALQGNFDAAAQAAGEATRAIATGLQQATLGGPEQFLNNLSKQTQSQLIPTINNAFAGAAAELGANVTASFLSGVNDKTVSNFVNDIINDAEDRAKARRAAEEAAAKAAKTGSGGGIVNDRSKLDALLAELRAEEQLLAAIGLTNAERKIEADLLRAKLSLAKEGVTLTAAQEDEIRVQLTVNDSFAAQVDVMEQLRGSQETMQRNLDATNAAFARGAITGAEYSRALLLIHEAGLTAFERTERDLRNQQKLLQIQGATNVERANAVTLEATLQQLRQEGVVPDDAAKAKLASLIASNAALERQSQIVEEQTPIQEQLAQKQRDAAAALDRGAISADQYARVLRQIKLDAAEAGTSISDGFTRGFAQVEKQLTDLASVTQNTLVNAFSAAENALVSFAETGKFSFADFARSIISDVLRIVARLLLLQALQALIPGFGSLVAAGPAVSGGFGAAFGGPRAEGGYADANRAYLVGEQGPELFQPGRNGTIVPHDNTVQAMAAAAGAQSGASLAQAASTPVHITIINQVDSEGIVDRGLQSPKGSKQMINQVGRNKGTIKRTIS